MAAEDRLGGGEFGVGLQRMDLVGGNAAIRAHNLGTGKPGGIERLAQLLHIVGVAPLQKKKKKKVKGKR